jgi:hypothetical protein
MKFGYMLFKEQERGRMVQQPSSRLLLGEEESTVERAKTPVRRVPDSNPGRELI